MKIKNIIKRIFCFSPKTVRSTINTQADIESELLQNQVMTIEPRETSFKDKLTIRTELEKEFDAGINIETKLLIFKILRELPIDVHLPIASVLTKSKSRAHDVSMEAKTCGCGKCQLFHYPCVHALAVCAQEGLSIRDCVAYEFTTQAYVDTWAQTFNPQPDI